MRKKYDLKYKYINHVPNSSVAWSECSQTEMEELNRSAHVRLQFQVDSAYGFTAHAEVQKHYGALFMDELCQ